MDAFPIHDRGEDTLDGGLTQEERKAVEASASISDHPMDGEEARAIHRRCLSWLHHERMRQAENRRQMAIDQDFKDGIQWGQEEAETVRARGQKPLVYNEIAVQINWITGTERQSRIDHRVLPREEDDFEGAVVKTKVLKYVDDANRTHHARSAAFEEAVTCGLSWLEDSLTDDATGELIYSGWESWRNILHDSHSRDILGRDMRYIIRWRTIDLDVAIAMWPDRAHVLRSAAVGADSLDQRLEDELWYIGDRIDTNESVWRDTTYAGSTTAEPNNQRARVRIYECWYRKPEQAQVVRGGPFNGFIYEPGHQGMERSIQQGKADIVPAKIMRMRVAYFTEGAMLAEGPSPFRHNEFPFTPIWCYRRGRDGMPYGFVRNLRDPQEDLNHRMSKSLFLLAVNQLITEYGAFDLQGEYTLQDAIDNASNPSGVFVMRDGSKRFEIRRDYNEVAVQSNIAMMDRQFMQTASGVTDELLGRKTNAISGMAIMARQQQGTLTTMTPFSNLRLAISLSGEKKLSNCEQFMSLPKVIRLTNYKSEPIDSPEFSNPNPQNSIEWVRINQPEIGPDGKVRFLNDITASKADFIVDDQDYTASMRQAMFEQMSKMISDIAPLAPQFAISMLDLVVDMADFPKKDEMVNRLRALIAEARGMNKTPEQAAAEAAMGQLAMRKAAAEIAEKEAKADKTDAEADAIRARLGPPSGATSAVPSVSPPPSSGAVAPPTYEVAPSQSAIPPPPSSGGVATSPIQPEFVQQLSALLAAQQQMAAQIVSVQQATAKALDGLAAGLSQDKSAIVAKSVEADSVKEVAGRVDGTAKKPRRIVINTGRGRLVAEISDNMGERVVDIRKEQSNE
jgi:hypothetical protein